MSRYNRNFVAEQCVIASGDTTTTRTGLNQRAETTTAFTPEANRPVGLEPDLERFPKVKALVARMAARSSFEANPVLWWEPGVIGYGEGGRTPIYKN